MEAVQRGLEEPWDETAPRRRRRGGRRRSFLTFAGIFIILVICLHAMQITMPYFWDEAGYYIPAALDFFTHGHLVPHNVSPTAHPPLLSLYLSLVWKLFGTSVVVTRLAMLVVAGLTLTAAFLLAVELCGSLAGVPALVAAGLLLISPLFFTQSLLAQLDLPATLFTALGLWLFLRERHGWAALACAALVLTKETGAVLPLVLALWLAFERRWRDAAVYAAALAVLAAWLVGLRLYLGFWLGSSGYGDYHTRLLAHPVQLLIGFARRFYYLFAANLHIIGTAGLLLALRAGSLNRRRWKVAALFAFAHIVVVTLFGSAMLERYLLPVLPLFYTAAVVGFAQIENTLVKIAAPALLLAGLAAGLFLNPPLWPFPYENNLAMQDFAELQAKTARYLEQEHPRDAIATAWPLSAALTQPRLGYVRNRLMVLPLDNFGEPAVGAVPKDSVSVFVRYSRDWDPPRTLLADRRVRYAAKYYFGYTPPAGPELIEQRLGLRLEHMFQSGGQWVEIYAKPKS